MDDILYLHCNSIFRVQGILKEWSGEKMRSKKEEFPIIILMTTYIIILLMYLFTYSQKSYLFWAFFAIERLLSINYEVEMENYLMEAEASDLSGMKIIITIVFTLLSVGIFLYTPFKYPGLFCILILGELIDFIGRKIKEHTKLR